MIARQDQVRDALAFPILFEGDSIVAFLAFPTLIVFQLYFSIYFLLPSGKLP